VGSSCSGSASATSGWGATSGGVSTAARLGALVLVALLRRAAAEPGATGEGWEMTGEAWATTTSAGTATLGRGWMGIGPATGAGVGCPVGPEEVAARLGVSSRTPSSFLLPVFMCVWSSGWKGA
jgi:hypothetical protein